MLTLAQAKLNKVYTIEGIQAEGFAKKHLNNLGFVSGGKVVLVNYSRENGIVLLHNSRIAINVSVLQQITIVEKSINEENWLSLDQLTVGEKARVIGIHGQGAVKRRLMDMGLTKGVDLLVRKMAPLGDPIEINLRGYELTLRKNEAELVLVQKEG
ncbi:ferrous iron transporter A [Enterococcus plantarum]|uniref:Ferrous iron transport protein A n=1 Tax=Enterococcus plantarum TaxID=1077675 RepID=A0A2W3ZMW8_9ENTE|nr:ferrous iron transport protein A [Enterococcus plantarum]MBO0424023.1 ferrous iron transport protein A [Enterococcus plantarum]MBO0467070.1 ferrous iron transport protein A [Enterococcus plantarum]OEG18273.1 ferrous iron transporter A [Enterococcus plantarum]PZL77917.1 ferrous iron transport protein A [Enterococcus plantarum]